MFDWPGESEEEKQKREKAQAAHWAREDLAGRLTENLTRTLSSLENAEDDLQTLQEQKQILDLAFRCLLSDADNRSQKLFQYALAFRAQSQFRYTLDAIRTLEKDKHEDEDA